MKEDEKAWDIYHKICMKQDRSEKKEKEKTEKVTDAKECVCFAIEKYISKECPDCDWNLDKACHLWHKLSSKLKFNKDVEREDYCCCCPICGRTVCGWCS